MTTDEQIERNGRIIAAAPDLYLALEAIVFAAQIEGPRTVAWAKLLETCRAALRKGNGGKW